MQAYILAESKHVLEFNSQGSSTFSRWILKAKIVSREFGSYDSNRCDIEKDICKILFLVWIKWRWGNN